MRALFDVAIIGGGPAGLSAALVLARCRRSVVVIDAGEPRNRRSHAVGGFLTRDGVAPERLLGRARAEVRRYGVRLVEGFARTVKLTREALYAIGLKGGASISARKLLLATGVRDELPAIEGLSAFYGTSVHHCPYCDAWQHRDRTLVAYGKGRKALGLALCLRNWSRRVVACTEGGWLPARAVGEARRGGVAVRPERVVRLEGRGGKLARIVFADGPPLACSAMFFNTEQVQRSDLPRLLGCSFKPDGGVFTDQHQCTGMRGLYLAGDADKDVQFVIVAAAEGATAAVAINRELQDEGRVW